MNTDIEQIFSQPVKNIHKYGAKTKFFSNPFIQLFSLILTLAIAKVEDKVGIPLCIKDFFKLQAGSQWQGSKSEVIKSGAEKWGLKVQTIETTQIRSIKLKEDVTKLSETRGRDDRIWKQR